MKLEITSVNAIIYNLGRKFTIVKLLNTNSYYKKTTYVNEFVITF